MDERVSVLKRHLEPIQENAIKHANGYLLLAVAALDPQPLTWQPIAGAPKDGTRVLLFGHFNNDPHRRTTRAVGLFADRWVVDGGNSDDGMRMRGVAFTPTHWMPLPEAPTKETNNA